MQPRTKCSPEHHGKVEQTESEGPEKEMEKEDNSWKPNEENVFSEGISNCKCS